MPLISSITPHAFHRWLNRKRGRASEDTFPTHYCANSCGDIARISAQSNFKAETIELIEGRPEYLRMFAATYIAGLAYERLVNALPVLDRFRVLLIGAVRKAS